MHLLPWLMTIARARRRTPPRQATLRFEPLEERRLLSSVPLSNSGIVSHTSLIVVGDRPPVVPATLQAYSASVSDGKATESTFGISLLQPTSLIVHFNDVASTEGGATGTHSVINTANWQLLKEGIDASSSISSIDFTVSVASRSWNYTYYSYTATLSLSHVLTSGNYQLIARHAIERPSGDALDGNLDGIPGDDATIPFSLGAIHSVTQDVEIDIATIDAGSAVAADLAGDHVVAWVSTTGAVPILEAQRFNPQGIAQGDPIQVSADVNVANIAAAMDASGDFVVTWDTGPTSATSGRTVWAHKFSAAGSSSGSEFRVDPAGSSSQTNASIAMEPDGNFIITWQNESPGGGSSVVAQRFGFDTLAMGSQFAVDTGSAPSITMRSSGDFIIAWQKPEPASTNSAVFARLYSFNGSAKGSTFEVNTTTAPATKPSVAMDEAGDFVMVWTSQQPARPEIHARRFNAAGQGVGLEFRVDAAPDALFGSTNPAVAMSRSGDFFVAWNTVDPTATDSYNAHNAGLQVRGFNASGAPVGDAFFPNDGFGVRPPAVATDAAGDWLLSWTQAVSYIHEAGGDTFGGTDDGIHIREFTSDHKAYLDLNGPKQGIDFSINLAAPGGPSPIVDSQQLLISNLNVASLTSATITLDSPVPGDALFVDTDGTKITPSYANGVLTLSGMDTVADYQQVLRTARLTVGNRAIGSTVDISFVVNNGLIDSETAHSRATIYQPGSTTVIAQNIFYNHSLFDGNDSSENSLDDRAIAIDKAALLPGQTATFANYTTFSRGINGILIDIAGQHGTIVASDFELKVGNSNSGDTWSTAPAPTIILVRSDAGVNGSDRVGLIWPDNAIENQWLEVTMKANGDTGLAAPDTFYFGNAIGDSGDSAIDASISPKDVLRTIDHIHGLANPDDPASISDRYDYNRDGLVSPHDVLIAIDQILAGSFPLVLISIPLSLGTFTVQDSPTIDTVAIRTALAFQTSASVPLSTQPFGPPAFGGSGGASSSTQVLAPQAVAAAFSQSSEIESSDQQADNSGVGSDTADGGDPFKVLDSGLGSVE